MTVDESNPRRYSPVVLLLVGVVALLLLTTSYLVEIRIIVEDPQYGDVTDTIQVLWRALLGLATIGSFLVGIYTLTTESKGVDRPTTKVKIKGIGHDIDVHRTVSVVGKTADPETTTEDDDASDGSDEQNTDGETAETTERADD